MAEPKTKATTETLTAFLARATDGEQRTDGAALARMMKKATGAPPTVLSTGIVGFGRYTMTYADGKTADWPLIAFAPRKGHTTLYLSGFAGRDALVAKLGPHKLSGSCLHIKRLGDVNLGVLDRLIAASVKAAKKKTQG
jgi:hypothetical protein